MKSKLISILLTTVMVCSLAACGNESNETSKENSKQSTSQSESKKDADVSEPVSENTEVTEVTYPLDTDETLTMAMMNYLYKPAGDAVDITYTPYWEELQKRTGVKVEMQVIESEDAFNLMLAGGELPDIILYAPVLYGGGQAQMIEDGIVSPLTWEEINKWAPNYGAALEEATQAGFDSIRKILTE